MTAATEIDFPLRGEWRCLWPPGHHPYARDFVAVGKDLRSSTTAGKIRFLFGGVAAERFYAWGQPVYAPFAGEVVRVGDGWLDRQSIGLLATLRIWVQATLLFRPRHQGGEFDIRPNVGNYVMLKHTSGVVALLAHLRAGSLRVAVGQRIAAGEPLGEVGNSGNSTAPHLHLNLFDQVDDLTRSAVVPFTLRRYARWNGSRWVAQEGRLPGKREVVRRHLES